MVKTTDTPAGATDFSDFSFSLVPNGYCLCFLDGCPRAGQCMRHMAAQHLPDGVMHGYAVFPNALNDGQCTQFKPVRKITMAWGFSALMHNILHKDNTTIRRRLYSYLGSRMAYYRHNNGTSLLTPEQQDGVLRIFKSLGYTEDLRFDHYCAVYDFL